MKATTTASAIRVTMTVTEARELITLAGDAVRLGIPISANLAGAIALLDCKRHDVQMAQARKRADKVASERHDQQRRDREHYRMIGDFSVMATRADYADVSRDPDYAQWVDVVLQECLSKPLPDQCEIRRDVWHVRVVRLATQNSDQNLVVGHDCTRSADRAEIEPLARRLIESATVTA